MTEEIDPGGEGAQRGFLPRHLRSWVHPSERHQAQDQVDAADGPLGGDEA